MNIASSHELSQANFLNSNAYIVAKCDIWQRDCILMLDMRYLSKYPKVALNSSRNVSKSLSKGANQTKVVLDNKVLTSLTWAGLIGY
jgi:hypothetical protein